MKRVWLVFIALGLCLLCAIAIKLTSQTTEKRRRAELHMIDLIKAGVSEQLVTGGELPNNWSSLSNIFTWESVAKMSQDNFIPPAAELYTVLPRPVFFNNYISTGAVFLVRSEPCAWYGPGSGRLALVATSNGVLRTWLSEKNLAVEIRSQLKD